MLFLQFQIGDDACALAADRIVEIVPLSNVRKMRRASHGMSDTFEYRGRSVPVIDLSALELGRPARRRLSTRIIVVRHPADETMLIGLVAEHATEVLRVEPEEFAPFVATPQGLVQRVELKDLLSASFLTSPSRELVAGA